MAFCINKTMTYIIAIGALFFAACVNVSAQGFSTKAKQAVVMDYDSATILYQKDADALIPPASLAKLMTMEVVFNALRSGELNTEDTFTISEDAWRRGGANSGGSSMFAKLNSDVRLDDLIRGVIVQSGNDAAIAIAEGMAGSEVGFAGLMNNRARKIGLEKSVFRNSTGLPHEEQLVTARELAHLARHMIKTYPEQYKIYSETSFKWGKINQRNRNPLLGKVEGADGLKTGFTKASGYGLVGSAVQNGRRVIIVLSGMKSKRERASESVKLMRWGFRAFKPVELFAQNEIVGEATLYGGEKSGVALRAEGPLNIFVPIGFQDRLKMEIVFQGPIATPVEEGVKVAKLQVKVDGVVSQETPLYTAESVGRGTVTQQALDAAKELMLGWIRF